MGFLNHSLALAIPYLIQYGYPAIIAAVMLEGIGVSTFGRTFVVAGGLPPGHGA
ncbi:hypothetical protein [Acidihalobacter prosperus]|uniref:Uncharacterized protein n=1 Tax=Acidihalobacter prosperus TaxID=160660 RepID=A0A1A6C8Q2_9GAMM|nr:hypothetical protein [Acidihalobacter prosperus]OBS10947.1 hypothetical protein Thpro_020663 [Acidihalobacter prosperus]